MYSIIRKHSEDSSEKIIDTAANKAEARKMIAAIIKDENARISTPHTTAKLGDVTNTKFTMSNGQTYSIGYWPEKA